MLIEAKAHGYFVNLVLIDLSIPELNQLRVSQRVSEGGHAVTSKKNVSRIPRTLVLMKQAVQIANCSLLFNNSSYDNPYRPIAKMK